jgi:hypothetical protein
VSCFSRLFTTASLSHSGARGEHRDPHRAEDRAFKPRLDRSL